MMNFKQGLISSIENKFLKNYFTNLDKYKDIHKGESCYIFGNGPSIKWFDLNNFRDRISICSGQLHYHKDFNLLNAKYLLLIEPWFFTDRYTRKLFASKEQSEIVENHRSVSIDYKFFTKKRENQDKKFFINLSNIFHLRGENIEYVYRTLPTDTINTDLELSKHNLFSGSFIASLTLAYHLGFSELYLVGFDAMTLSPALNKRFYEYGKGELSKVEPIETEILKVFKKNMDINVISHDSSSPIFNYCDYRSFFGTEPSYRENHEIISNEFLKIMEKIAGYDIYNDLII